MLDEILIVIIN